MFVTTAVEKEYTPLGHLPLKLYSAGEPTTLFSGLSFQSQMLEQLEGTSNLGKWMVTWTDRVRRDLGRPYFKGRSVEKFK